MPINVWHRSIFIFWSTMWEKMNENKMRWTHKKGNDNSQTLFMDALNFIDSWGAIKQRYDLIMFSQLFFSLLLPYTLHTASSFIDSLYFHLTIFLNLSILFWHYTNDDDDDYDYNSNGDLICVLVWMFEFFNSYICFFCVFVVVFFSSHCYYIGLCSNFKVSKILQFPVNIQSKRSSYAPKEWEWLKWIRIQTNDMTTI